MGATNTTANYSLSQFIGTDKPAWLQDYNGDMLKIDTGINAAKVAADGAQNAASAAQNDATTANNAITNTINPAISSLNTTVGNQGGAINTINSLIGNGTPTTTDQTIIGAINEINAKTDEDLLWTNSSPTTSFSDQTLVLDLSDYRALEIVFKSSISSTIVFVERCYIDSSLYIASAPTSQIRYRTFTPSSTGIQFDVGKLVTSYGITPTDSNDYVLPLYIRGIK